MSGDMRPYVVRQGDYLIKLAFVHGFDAEEVWNDAKNEEIRGRRGDHNILAPGDIVYLPVKEKAGLAIVKGETNKYTAKVPKTTVSLRFNGENGPLANEPYVIEGIGDQEEKTTDADGAIAVQVPVNVREFHVFFPERNVIHPVRVGDMDPIDEPAGVRKRLQHLGYGHSWVPDDSSSEDVAARIASCDFLALSAFQKDHGLEPTGSLDAVTKAELVKKHGS